jgi:hypothetical protein
MIHAPRHRLSLTKIILTAVPAKAEAPSGESESIIWRPCGRRAVFQAARPRIDIVEFVLRTRATIAR